MSYCQIYNTDWLIYPRPPYDKPMGKTFARMEPWMSHHLYTYTKLSYVIIKLNTWTYMHGTYVKEELIMGKKKKHIVLYCGSWMLAYLRYQYHNQKSNPPWQRQCKLPTHRKWSLQGNSFLDHHCWINPCSTRSEQQEKENNKIKKKDEKQEVKVWRKRYELD